MINHITLEVAVTEVAVIYAEFPATIAICSLPSVAINIQ